MKKNISLIIIGIVILVFSSIFSLVAYQKHQTNNYGLELDNALQFQAMHNSVNGKYLQQTISLPDSILEQNALFLSVFISPIYYLVNNSIVLIIILSFMVMVGALPAFLLGNHYLGRIGGYFFSATYLIYSPLHALILEGFRYEPMHISILLFAFYFLVKEDFSKYIISVCVALLVKEKIAITVIMLGIYALFKTKKWKFGVYPIAISIIYLLLISQTVMKHTAAVEDTHTIKMYLQHGDTIYQNIQYYAENPNQFFNRIYLNEKLANSTTILFQGPLILSVASPATLVIAAPSALQMLMLPHEWFMDKPLIFTHDNRFFSSIIFAIFVSAILGLATILKIIPKKYHSLILVLLFLFQIYSVINITDYSIYKSGNNYAYTNIINLPEFSIPDNASLSADIRIIGHFYDRNELYIFNKFPSKDLTVEYVLIDYKSKPWKPWDINYENNINSMFANRDIVAINEQYALLK